MQPQKQLHQQPEINAHRQQVRESFLASCGWPHVTMEPLQADASFRRYYRLQGAAKPMLLMQDPPDRPAVTPYVMVEPYIKIANHLRTIGLRTPEIYAQDIPNGLLAIEDFGDDTYTRLFNRGVDPQPLYETAVDALIHLHRHAERCRIELAEYDDQRLAEESMLLLDWYYPQLTGKKPTEAMKASFTAVWQELFKKMPKNQQTLVLRDYHVDNLMLAKDGTGIGLCGLLDFQDAVLGQCSYDLMSLLEDARRAMPEDLRQHLYDRYMQGMGAAFDKTSFDYSFRVLAAQRHAKVLGIFVRLFARDGKSQYLHFIPHVHQLFVNAVNDPALKPLKTWFAENNFDISTPLRQPT